ncbi:T9SS type B sorting domain-containing protein [Chryseobacterium pennipullorum]|uniref:Gliding motility-associated C-terminal domain-containing protein n=1 Tax=Chryseobacterium pennipullorum TaxID=2258963 RepID=A0A3D9B1D2_9FLAO|nr:gliding motility-associated C-terminal domain-containing protein [Chryseobacterium pennipullorum]REC47086.1 gliding motility-associated C-terminal domain-containing protein [Chryseobacterium pennipullorum]
MKKILSVIVLLFAAINMLFAQRDTEHWFAPMAARSPKVVTPKQALYFSTDSVTPFAVEIFSNNALLGTVTISKGSPQTFDIPLNRMVASTNSELFSPGNKGLYTKGAKPYFVTYRFSVSQHGEILTSKGKAGIGTKFYAVTAPLEELNGEYNFTTGILATEDNTQITVSDYSANIEFTNGWNAINHPTLTFTLNKGQSYIIEGVGDKAVNKEAFIGAKIESDKPISVTNGNFNGQFAMAAGGSYQGSDIIMDQSVPVDRLGNEFVVVKGNGDIARRMEDALIVATEGGTQVYINNGTTPVATLAEGESYRVNKLTNTGYINQGNNHYNMYIRTTKNVYVYQLMAGVAGSNATLGFNYIPPLNCYLPRKIDEIGKIKDLPYQGSLSGHIVKLNILTETGAAVTINGATPPAAQGPYPVTGTPNWVSYSVPDISGNVTITSTKAVTAGISGGSGVVGYGGYFSGFSSIPVIAKQNGDCIPGLVLEVDDSFETYQWFRDNTAIAGATSNSYTPTQSGNYTVRITVGSCPPVTTPIYKVYTCLTKTTLNDTVCDGVKQIVPTFSSSTQTVVPGTVTIITPPTNGNAVIDPATGVISYAPAYNYIGPDTIVYKFCGNNPDFTDCEEVTLNLTVSESPIVNDALLRTCFLEANIATGQFNLTNASVHGAGTFTKKYYPSLADAHAGTNEILNPTAYVAPNGVVYIKVINGNGCYRVAQVTLVVLAPVKSDVLVDKIICMEGKTTLDAGPGFKSYEWSTGATTQAIHNVGVGVYWVKLTTGECVTMQSVKVYASEQPVVANIDISSNTITVYVIGGTPPYQYSVDNINWQNSNVFNNMPRGAASIYVKDDYNCEPIQVDFTIPNLINVITPNEDGINDAIDYSSLDIKNNLVLNIYDRYGIKVYQVDKSTGYKWNGTFDGSKRVPTGSYWYEVSWNEANSKQTPIKYTGWVLVKNRE